MKKSILFWAVCGLLIGMTACEPKPEPTPTPDPEPKDTFAIFENFPKKHLLEEFTGQDCGYCPYGMDCVHEYIQKDTNWIVVLHHYGYSPDHFSVAGSKKITSKLGVSGAPSIAIDRAKTAYVEEGKNRNTIVFYPGYLPTAKKSQFADSTYASIRLNNTYDAAARKLTVHVSGKIGAKCYPAIKLTLLVKESGMVDYQADNYETYEGWQEFRHCNAVRAFLTAPLGDTISVDSLYQYEAEYEVAISDKWVAENCAVVALLAEDFNPVLQAEQKPVVDGTKGGADILHGGITKVPVADYYPEPGADIAPSTYSGQETDTLTMASTKYQDYANYGFRFWQIQAYNANQTVTVNKTVCVPFAWLYLFTELNAPSIAVGTYPVNGTMQPGTVWAGYRNDEDIELGGSMFYYASLSYLQQNYLVDEAEWLVADGELVVREDGWELTGHALNGSDIHLVGTTPIQNGGKAGAPARRVMQQAEAPKARIISLR